MSVSAYIQELLSYEEYAFSLEEVLAISSKTKTAIKREISRLIQKREIVNLRRGFYLILPPRYRKFGTLPIELFVEKLFHYLGKPYYLACYSAARHYGATHQAIQEEYIITSPPALLEIKRPIHIKFLTTSNWPPKNILQKKSDSGYYNISSPALTIIDLLNYHLALGGINRVFFTLEELLEELRIKDLESLLSWYPTNSHLQRLGYMLDILPIDKKYPDAVFQTLNNRTTYPIFLSPEAGQKAGKIGNRWNVDVNTQLISEL